MFELFKGVFWIVAWEVVKVCSGVALKRKGDKSDNKRRMVREDLSACTDQLNVCLQSAREYFTGETTIEARRALGQEIRHQTYVLSTRLNSTSVGLRALGGEEVNLGLIYRFRQALTMQLDSAKWVRLDENSTPINEMYKAGHLLSLEIAKLKYEHA